MTRFQIVLVRPAGFAHVEALREIIEALQEGFADLGCRVPVHENSGERGLVPIVFAAQHLRSEAAHKLPEDTILFNAEQLVEGYPWYVERYLSLLDRFEVWDFSARNIARLQARGRSRPVHHLPVPFSRTLTRIAAGPEDIDVLFIGRMSARRRSVLDAIAVQGFRVHAAVSTYGRERDALIARAKVLLNVHAADAGAFESARVVYLMANRKAVVCESEDAGDVEADLAPGLRLAGYERLADACVELVKDEAARAQLQQLAFDAVRSPSRRASQAIERILAARMRSSHG